MRFVLLAVLLTAGGCEKTAPVDNAATRYTDSLQTSVESAREAQEKANRAIQEREKISQELNSAAE